MIRFKFVKLSEAPEIQALVAANSAPYTRVEITPTNGQTVINLENYNLITKAHALVHINRILADDGVDYAWGEDALIWLDDSLESTDKLTLFLSYSEG